MFASEPSSTSSRPNRSPITRYLHLLHNAVLRPTRAHELEQPPKPRSRRCFVCGTTGRHPLDFRVCSRTAVLPRRSLAKINDKGRLVSFDGSPLPMTRHPAVLLRTSSRASARAIPKRLESPPTPRVAHIPPQPVAVEPRVPSPPREFSSSFPHAIPPLRRAEPMPEHIPLRRFTSPFDHVLHGPSDALSRARALWLVVLLDSLLNGVFQSQLRAVMSLLDSLGVQDPSALRRLFRPVFERISLPLM
ncbi:hypothetical protein DFH09DRAFT_1318743 [Mycena vulgaris]|nr:hypothetical protein DFH09DRAFT_1375260 [Mycena vulgaris]KAJ6553720.1 hypothetical protein DFH09DRAFT_1318743 [Mycena vulgaris]